MALFDKEINNIVNKIADLKLQETELYNLRCELSNQYSKMPEPDSVIFSLLDYVQVRLVYRHLHQIDIAKMYGSLAPLLLAKELNGGFKPIGSINKNIQYNAGHYLLNFSYSFRTDACSSSELKIQWYTELESGSIMDICIEAGVSNLVTYPWETERSSIYKNGKVRPVISNKLVDVGLNHIRWAGDNGKNSFTFYPSIGNVNDLPTTLKLLEIID